MANNKNNNKIDLDKAAEQSGESTLFGSPRYDLPILRIQGKEGNFLKITKDKTGISKTDILTAKEIEGTTLKFRRTLTRFTKEESYFTTEHSSPNDTISLFEVKTKADGTKSVAMIDTGTAKDIKEKDQKLKMTQVVYFLWGKEVVKLQIKGSSLKNFYEFRQEVKKKDKHFFQFVIGIEMERVEGKLGEYYTMKFKIVEELKNAKLKAVLGKITEVSDKLESIDSYYKSTAGKETGERAGEAITAQAEKEDKDEEEINVDTLPF